MPVRQGRFADTGRRQTIRLIDAEPIIKNLSAMKTQLGYDAIDIDGMIKALREAKVVTDAPLPSDPLTLEELREMGGEPVWCESEHRPDGSGWFLVDASALQPHEFIAIGRERGIPCAGIDTGYWLAYRHKPEEGST